MTKDWRLFQGQTWRSRGGGLHEQHRRDLAQLRRQELRQQEEDHRRRLERQRQIPQPR